MNAGHHQYLSKPVARGLALAVGLALVLAGPGLRAAEQATQQSAMSDLLGGLWAKLRVSIKKPAAASDMPTITAGIRGAEATESGLKPYWKDDREMDPAQRPEAVALKGAQDLADAQRFAEAAPAFEAFVAAHPTSPLAPSAQFGVALSRAALGDKTKAGAAFEDFVKKYPQHPLVNEAQQALVALQK